MFTGSESMSPDGTVEFINYPMNNELNLDEHTTMNTFEMPLCSVLNTSHYK